MDKINLLDIIKKLLKTEDDMDFLMTLKESDLERLIVCIRERFDKLENGHDKVNRITEYGK